jgi:hypothetical protein
MPPILIPDAYWDLTPPVFEGLTATFLQPLADVFDVANGDYAALTGADAGELETQLGAVDGDADPLMARVAEETDAVHSATADEVLGHYDAADALAVAADGAVTTPAPPTGGGPDNEPGPPRI